ncbi:MAG: fructosamine kinase family protein [Leptospiraceae bacterium]|nr:fructosamine kinase family protein [Leptospiraceae bacterium]
MIKLIEQGLDFLNFDKRNCSISFLTQSCFPIYKVYLPKENHNLAVKILNEKEIAVSELNSLKYLKEKKCPVPNTYRIFSNDKNFLLFMDYVEEQNNSDKQKKLIATLKILFGNTNAKWGFDDNNYIGGLHQKNSFHESFDSFYWQTRIEPQLRLCFENKIFDLSFFQKTEKLILKKISDWNLNSATPRLIHGDLWSGNILFGDKAYLIDPSISYAHPEQDLAMLDLFGSPLDFLHLNILLTEIGSAPDFQNRIPFWQIYPLLVHVNLFGGNYIHRTKDVISRLEKI